MLSLKNHTAPLAIEAGRPLLNRLLWVNIASFTAGVLLLGVGFFLISSVWVMALLGLLCLLSSFFAGLWVQKRVVAPLYELVGKLRKEKEHAIIETTQM